jgi:hypothetical protein
VPSLVFSSDFTQQVKGELVAGGYVAIDYDIARAKCKSTIGKYGYDSKTVSAFVSLNGKEAVEQVVHLNKQTHKPHFKLAEKGQLAVWFKCSSSVDTVFDSNFSKNYIFTVQ